VPKYSKAEKQRYLAERRALELNPCPGRTTTEREYITRRLLDIVGELDHHLERVSPAEPQWLPEGVITPAIEADYIESRERFENTPRDEYGYITDMPRGNKRATNRVRVATWYKNTDGSLYMIALIMVSPLPCATWGALPLTLKQWRILIPAMIATHMHWKWVHTVRQYWTDSTWQVGGTFGWYMERCKRLTQDDSELCTGQAIYAHVVRQYSDHVLET